MSHELGSLDDVLADDELISALAERRLDEVRGDELSATLAGWCVDLDTEPTTPSLPAADLAEAVARRRALRRTGRSLAAAAAVAVVCVGGLAVSRLAMHESHDRPTTADTGATASTQARQRIWEQLGEARTALMQRQWSTASRLLDQARAELPQVSVADGRAALSSWIALLDKAVHEHASLDPNSGPDLSNHAVSPQHYNGGVPLPPGMAPPTETASSTLPVLPTTLPSLRPSPRDEPTRSAASGPHTSPPASQPAPTSVPSHRASSPPVAPSKPPSPTASPTENEPTLPVGPLPTPVPRVLLPLQTLAKTSTPMPTTSTPTPSAN